MTFNELSIAVLLKANCILKYTHLVKDADKCEFMYFNLHMFNRT